MGNAADSFFDFVIEFPGHIFAGIANDWLNEGKAQFDHFVFVVYDLFFIDGFLLLAGSNSQHFILDNIYRTIRIINKHTNHVLLVGKFFFRIESTNSLMF